MQDRALPHRVVALGVDWTSFVMKDLVELVLRLVGLLTMWCAIHSADSVVRLTLTRRIQLVAGPSMVIVALPVVVVVAAVKATAFLLRFICQRCIMSRRSTTVLGRLRPKSRYSDWTVMPLWK